MNARISDRGYSITELLLVVAIIAVISAIAVPTFSDVHVRRLQAATSEVVAALRFARHEAIRTGIPHGVRKLNGQNSISVFRMDMDQNPRVEIHDVLHPVEFGQLYQVDLETYRRTLSTTIVAYFKIYADAVTHEAISFNSRGEPIDGVSGKPLWLTQGGFLLNNGDRGTVVSLSRLAGRVASGEIGEVISDPTAVF